ncbi:MAG: T9SS type A sorting domain-containing protein, partial [Candidatus Cloacimonetes bacterium]|nr:T9SS type A sorting domain-containing protein [Candidatus Cloacimonadota bacterium]
NVFLSTTGNAINDFDVTLENVIGLDASYVEFSYDLSAYAGQDIYLAIEWIQDTYAMVVDDVKVGQAEPNDVGMVSIEYPKDYHFLESEIIPSGTIMNYGTADITENFDITCEIYNENAEVVYLNTVNHIGTISPAETEEVIFADLWIPAEIGTYYITMITFLADDANTNNDGFSVETEIVIHYGTSDPDAFGYQWIDSTVEDGPIYDWIEISETGTSSIMYEVPAFYGDDNFSDPIDFGFSFPFYGIDRTYCYIDTNGELLLADNTWYHALDPYGIWQGDGNMFNYMYPIPGYTQMPALIAAYWDDLEVDEGIGDVYFQTFGEAPNRYFVIEWHNVRFHAGTGGEPTLCFEIILHENGEIVFQYQNVANGQVSSIPHDYGASSTIAIQNDTANIGLCYLREIVENQQYYGVEPYGNLLVNELAIRFYQGEDLQTPFILYEEEKGNTFDNNPDISVTILDASGIISDQLFYDIGDGWESITHSSIEENIYHYQFPEIPNSTTVNYYFSATDNSEAQNSGTLPQNAPSEYFTFKILPTEGVNVLLAHPGTIPGYQDYTGVNFAKYVNALNTAGVDYDIYNWAEYDDYAFPECYEAIITYANGVGALDLHNNFAIAMMNFLDSGTNDEPKNIFMASDDFGFKQHGYSNDTPIRKFFEAYLRGRYIPIANPSLPPFGGTDGIGGPDIYDYSDGSVLITSESVVGNNGQELQVYSNSPDVLEERACPSWYQDEVVNPGISSISAFIFEDGPIDGNAYGYHNSAALSLDNIIYKSFYTSFDISQFTNDDDINMIISDAIDWFDIDESGTDNPITSPVISSLEQNYPNPFNPTTNILFSTTESTENTELSIYNIKGQKVKTLVNDKLETGDHSIVWDGKDDSSKQVSSGIYFYKMKSGKYTATKKMILMK